MCLTGMCVYVSERERERPRLLSCVPCDAYFVDACPSSDTGDSTAQDIVKNISRYSSAEDSTSAAYKQWVQTHEPLFDPVQNVVSMLLHTEPGR